MGSGKSRPCKPCVPCTPCLCPTCTGGSRGGGGSSSASQSSHGSAVVQPHVVLYNSAATDPSLGDIVAVPTSNYAGVDVWEQAVPAVRGPGVITISKGTFGTVPITDDGYYLWAMPALGGGSGSGGGGAIPLVELISLQVNMNDTNGQTTYTFGGTGATFYRAVSPAWGPVYVFGQTGAGFPSDNGVGVRGTYVYTPEGLRWTNVYNQNDLFMTAPVPPGFVLESSNDGSSWYPAPTPVTIYNSADNGHWMHTLIIVPSTNYGSGVQMWQEADPPIQGPGVQYVARGQMVSLPSGYLDFDIWAVVGSGSGSGSGTSIVPLTDTLALKYSMNDYNLQTAVEDRNTGAVFYRAFTPAGTDVFVFGCIDDATGSGSGVGQRGTYYYSPLQLTWTNIHNRVNPGLQQPTPPGFVLQQS